MAVQAETGIMKQTRLGEPPVMFGDVLAMQDGVEPNQAPAIYLGLCRMAIASSIWAVLRAGHETRDKCRRALRTCASRVMETSGLSAAD
jgi:hypothetical protein